MTNYAVGKLYATKIFSLSEMGPKELITIQQWFSVSWVPSLLFKPKLPRILLYILNKIQKVFSLDSNILPGEPRNHLPPC